MSETLLQIPFSATPLINTAAWFGTNNPVLEAGRFGITSDTKIVKIGDGTSAWADLTEVDRAGKILASVEITSLASANYSAVADVAGLVGLVAPQVPFPSEIELWLPSVWGNTAADRFGFFIIEGASTVVATDRITIASNGNQHSKNLTARVSRAANAVSATYKVQALRLAGTGAVLCDATVISPAYLRVIAR